MGSLIESPKLTLSDAAELVGGRIFGDGSVTLGGVRAPQRAGPEDFAFLVDAVYLEDLERSEAGAVLTTEEFAASLPGKRNALVVPDAQVALVSLLEHFHPTPIPAPGIHPTAVLGVNVVIGEGVQVAPYAVVGDRAELGDGCTIGAHVVIGAGCKVGERSVLHPHAVLYAGAELGRRVILHSGARVGVDGFGYIPGPDGPRRVPHRGPCVIADDVEIGANSCVDRGSLDGTELGRGTKLDNLVHIAHNVRVGQGTLMAALVGIAGSCRIGSGTQWGGQAGCIPHQNVGDGARMAAKTGISNDVPPGETMMSFPSRPQREHLKALAGLYKLGDLKRRVRALEARVQDNGA
jgi:UDP-3-O-[3-hydroxymyristoyl] glucosamine N-acyltransferase